MSHLQSRLRDCLLTIGWAIVLFFIVYGVWSFLEDLANALSHGGAR